MTKCCAPNCVHSQKSTEFIFYEFPQNPSLRKKWIASIGRPNWIPGRRSMICSAHFEKTQFRVENQFQLLEGAVPSLFQSSSKRRGLDASKETSSGVIEKSTVGDKKDKLQHNSSKIIEEITDSVNCNSSINAPLTDVTTQAGKFMDEMVLIDGTYILEDCELVNSKAHSSDSPTSCYSLTCVSSSEDNVMNSVNTCYPSLDDTLVLGEESSTTQENVMLLNSTSPKNACPEMFVIPETPQSESAGIIFVQQPSEGKATGWKRKPCVNLSAVTTPCPSNTKAATSDIGKPPEQDSQVRPGIIIVPPCKRRKLTGENCGVAVVKNRQTEPITSELNNVVDPSVPVLSLEKGAVDLPVSLTHHVLGKRTHAATKWQDGTFMCRLCGIASNKTVNLFSSEATNIKLLERMMSVLPIMIDKNDNLPQNVCSKCLSHLDACSDLIVNSFHTHKQLACVMGQDINQSSQLSVYFHEIKKTHENITDCVRHILLMEICHTEGKPVEEYLSIALEDLNMRLHPKSNSNNEPHCNLLLASISNSCTVSQVEQVRAAAEALMFKRVIQDEREQVLLTSDEEKRGNAFFDIGDISHDQDTNEAGPETAPDQIETFEYEFATPETKLDQIETIACELVEPVMGFELAEVQVMPVTDDASPSDIFSIGIRCPKYQQLWKRRSSAFESMQNSVCWQTRHGKVELICKICECILCRKGDIQDHLKNHFGSCHVCLVVFRSQYECESHICDEKPPVIQPAKSSDENLRPSSRKGMFRLWYQCSLCNARLETKPSLREHMEEQHATNTQRGSSGFDAINVCEATLYRQQCSDFRKGKEWQCGKCLEIFSIEEDLQEHHALSGHGVTTKWLCDICGKRFPQASKLSQHKKYHLPPEFKYLHQCPHCHKRYINSSRLKEHMQKHEEKNYMCKVCGKLFSTRQILKQHEFTHGDPKYLCSLCSRTFFRKSHLLKHMNVHNPDNSRASRAGPQPHRDGLNRCRECRKVFEQKELLQHYKLSHPQISLQKYTCEICKEENTSHAELFQHQREVHKTGVKDCPFCKKIIDSSTQMKYHLMKHEGMFPYNCPMCSNGYTANSILQDHIRRKHTGEKPFECHLCSKRFATSGALAQHSSVHSLPHQLLPCPMCHQGFKRKAHLDVHLRTHTGEKPYPCPICDRPFRQRPDCVKHIRVMHGEDPSKCDIRFHPNMCVTSPQVVSVADMELVLEGEDLMQTSLEAN